MLAVVVEVSARRALGEFAPGCCHLQQAAGRFGIVKLLRQCKAFAGELAVSLAVPHKFPTPSSEGKPQAKFNRFLETPKIYRFRCRNHQKSPGVLRHMVANKEANARRFRQYAEDCRRMAERLPPNQKEKMLEIAQAWEDTAHLIDGQMREVVDDED